MMEEEKEINFSCPDCLGELKLKLNDENLNCLVCKANFKKKDNIYRFVSESNYSASFGYQWNKFRKTQLDSYTGKPISKDRLSKVLNWSENITNKKVLEAGSGAGRFTEILVKTGARIFSFDFSSAVEANYLNNGAFKNLNIFQGDIFKIPIEDNFFDFVLCIGVIQHTPDPKGAFDSLKKKLKPGGTIFIDCYALKWHHYLQWKYILRPLTKRMDQSILLKIISFLSPLLIPLVKFSKFMFGKAGSRIFPIVEYSELGLSKEINKDWSILDTFDMYSAVYDHPKSIREVTSWFSEDEFTDIEVWYGDNGVVARAKKI